MSPNTTPNADKAKPVVDALEMRISWAQDYQPIPQDLKQNLEARRQFFWIFDWQIRGADGSHSVAVRKFRLWHNVDSLERGLICDSRGVLIQIEPYGHAAVRFQPGEIQTISSSLAERLIYRLAALLVGPSCAAQVSLESSRSHPPARRLVKNNRFGA